MPLEQLPPGAEQYQAALNRHWPRNRFQRAERKFMDSIIQTAAHVLNWWHNLETAAQQAFDTLRISLDIRPQQHETLDWFREHVLTTSPWWLIIANHAPLLWLMAPLYITSWLPNVKAVVWRRVYKPFTKLFGTEQLVMASKHYCSYIVELIYAWHLVVFFPAWWDESYEQTIFFREGFGEVLSQLAPQHDIISVYTDNSYLDRMSWPFWNIIKRLWLAALHSKLPFIPQQHKSFELPVHLTHHKADMRQEELKIAESLDVCPKTAARTFYLEQFWLLSDRK